MHLETKKVSLWRRLGHGVDALRRFTLNLVFLILLLALAVFLFPGRGPRVPETAALVIAPRGNLVEQLSGDPVSRALDRWTGNEREETLLWDLLDAIDAARDDDRIQALLLDLDGLGGAGLPKLQDLEAAIERFRGSGKPVIAAADNYSQNAYYLAAGADEIYLHEMGMVLPTGYGRFRTYYHDGLDRLGVDVHVFRVGEYKSAVEPFLRNDMSEEAKQANLAYLDDLWGDWTSEVAAARGIFEEAIRAYAERLPERLTATSGDAAQAALAAGLVDYAAGRDAVRDRLVELVGEDEDSHSFHRIGHQAYLESLGEGGRRYRAGRGDRVGVIVARGSIVDGSQPPGTIGGDSTAALVRRARHDDDVKAVVLRVDSGGGSAFASEVIRRELALLREAGKPMVVSMGSVAASGGYWISTASDEIWASPTTLTGSIGIFGIIPTFQRPLARYLGMRVDGVGTTPLAGSLRLDRELPAEAAAAVQQMVDQGYRDFLERVAEARKMTPEEVDHIARGRIWSGEDARELGLVDRLGNLDDAIASAAERAGLGEEEYGVEFLEKEPSFRQRLLADLLGRAAAWSGHERDDAPAAPYLTVLRSLAREAAVLAELNDPRGLYAHCFCGAE